MNIIVFDLENTLVKNWLTNTTTDLCTPILDFLDKIHKENINVEYHLLSYALDTDEDKDFFMRYHAPAILNTYNIVFNKVWMCNELLAATGIDSLDKLKFKKKYRTFTEDLYFLYDSYDKVFLIDDTNPDSIQTYGNIVLGNPHSISFNETL